MSAVTAARDLPFGRLALRHGLNDQNQLVAAFCAWTRARHRSLAAYPELTSLGSILGPIRRLTSRSIASARSPTRAAKSRPYPWSNLAISASRAASPKAMR
jgi:hypothetical protein